MLNSFIQTQTFRENDPYKIPDKSIIILINPFKGPYQGARWPDGQSQLGTVKPG